MKCAETPEEHYNETVREGACDYGRARRKLIAERTRELEALTLRSRGLTFEQVGRHFGVSKERARQMIILAERLLNRVSKPLEPVWVVGVGWIKLSLTQRRALYLEGKLR